MTLLARRRKMDDLERSNG